METGRVGSGFGETQGRIVAWRSGDFVLSPAQRRLLRNGTAVELEERAFDLIQLLAENHQRALDRREITATLWGARPVSDNTLRQLVYKARRALGDDGEHQNFIRTLHGRSMQWVAPLEPIFAVAGKESGEVKTAVPTRALELAQRHRASWPRIAAAMVLSLTAASLWISKAYAPDKSPRPNSPITASIQPPTQSAAASSGPTTIAVLPFLDMDADQRDRYLCDGITEELITSLGSIAALRVAAPTSVFVFGGKPVDVRQAASALNVANVLEGSVQRSGNRLRVRVALVSAKDGYELWTQRYDIAESGLLDVEDTIVDSVMQKLRLTLDRRSLAALHAHAAVDPAAHDFYLVGMEYLNRRSEPDVRQSILYFRRAIQADPGYASAWNAVATSNALLRYIHDELPPDTYYPEALAAAEKALALDPKNARAHAVLGLLEDQHWQWVPAAHQFQLALQLDPSDASAHQWYAVHLWATGDLSGAVEQMRAARDLDPLSPIINADLGFALLYAGQVDAAMVQAKSAIAAAPQFPLDHLLLAQADMAKKHNLDALHEMRTAVALNHTPVPAEYLALLGVTQSLVGDKAGTRQQLAILESRRRKHYVSGVALAWLYAQLGKRDQVFASVNNAVTEHDPLLQLANVLRADAWGSDPRLAELLPRNTVARR